MIRIRNIKERVYVKVTSDCDTTGYVQPLSVTWKDGRTFAIESVKDFRPAGTAGNDIYGDCYTVVIRGEEKYLFYERIDSRFAGRVGRWFVEVDTIENVGEIEKNKNVRRIVQ